MSTAPTSPPPKKQPTWLWWLIGLGAFAVVVLIVGGLLIASYFVKGVRVDPGKRAVEVRTPAGDLRVAEGAPQGLDLPVYPGAMLDDSGGSVELNMGGDESVGVVAARYYTADSLNAVDAWYRERLGPGFRREGPGTKRGNVRVQGVTVDTEDVAYIYDKDDLVRVVALKKRGAGVEIALARVGKREAQ